MTPEATMIGAVIGGIVTIASLAIAFASFFAKAKNDRGEDMAKDAKVMTKLDFIADDVKDIKAEYRNIRTQVDDVRSTANHAVERAEAAHNRIDRLESAMKE